MLLARSLAGGELSRTLLDNEEGFALDLLIRKMGISQGAEEEIEGLSDEARKWCLAYCEGVNSYLDHYGFPLLFRMLKCSLEPWSLADTMRLIKMQMYIGLGQVQERTEAFIIQALHDGVDLGCLKKIFSPHLDAIDGELLHLIKNVRLERPFLDKLPFEPAFSNNWAIAGSKTESGMPLCAHDPHLQVNRLPAFWYEAILQTPEDFQTGITVPGSPGLVMGRSRTLYASFTYGMMDTLDFFVEKVEKNCVHREEGLSPLAVREEVIHRKKGGEVTLKFFESDCGVIETQDYRRDSLEDGFYLALKWSCARKAIFPMINAMAELWKQECVESAGKIVREMTLSCNWVLADHKGNIGYQQSGRLPERSHSGLFPLPAWKKENHWQGYVEAEKLSSLYNPASGFVATANDDKNQAGKPLSINVPYANYRYEVICQRLSQDKKFSLKEVKELQCDLYSLQAHCFLEQMRELIPNTPAGEILRAWDCRYTTSSKGATLFEAFYSELLEDIFGHYFGKRAWQALASRHSLLMFTHGHFDRTLLAEDSWFGKEGRKACLQRVLQSALKKFSSSIPAWGEKNRFTMTNLLFNGKLPRFLEFDRGPFEMPGNRATVAASVVFNAGRLKFAVGATHRCVTDLATDEVFTILAGGPSEKRFSGLYATDIKKWLNFEYKKLSPL